MNNYLGIDIGTSACKAAVFNEHGNQVAAARREYDIISLHAGWAELDTDIVIDKCFDVIREAASQIEIGQVVGMGISSQGEAFTLIDEEGRALCKALVSSDSRAKDLIDTWTEEFGEDKLYRITGHSPHPMFSLFKLLWIKKNKPEIWKKNHKILCFEDLLQFRLGVQNPSMGWPLAGRTMLFDILHHDWNDEILKKIGLKKNQLSKSLQSGSLAGYVDITIARDLKLSEKTFIVTGGHDQPCSGLGTGAITPGIAAYNSGTVECITPAFNNPVFTDELRNNNLCSYNHAAPGKYASVAFSLTGGNLLKWFRDEFGNQEINEAGRSKSNSYELLLNQIPENPSRLLVLPYFTPTGTPYFDESVKGAIFGLDFSVTRLEILKALLEGVAMEMKMNLEILKDSGCPVNELRIIGGGSKSMKHVQLKSDVIGMPVTIMNVSEAGCLGVAMLAYASHSSQDVVKIAEKWVKPVSRVYPQNKIHYDIIFENYRRLYPALKELQK